MNSSFSILISLKILRIAFQITQIGKKEIFYYNS